MILTRPPAISPANVLDAQTAKHLKLNPAQALENLKILRKSQLAQTMTEALKTESKSASTSSIEKALSGSEISADDNQRRAEVYQSKPVDLSDLDLKFDDPRFKHLQFLYQARNFPKTLKTDQLVRWETYRRQLFFQNKPSALDFFKRQMNKMLSNQPTAQEQNILEELNLYVTNLLPTST